MHVLVTGGAGFIGSTLVGQLLRSGDHRVTVLDALTYAGVRSNLAEFDDDPRFRFVRGDVCDRDAVEAALDGCDAVAHLAAESHVDRSLLDPDVFVRTNCLGTNVVCDLAARAGVERFLHVSTDEVYGSIEVGSFSESDMLRPRSPYAASKAASDQIAVAYHETHDLPVVLTRSTNQFGPRQFPEKLVPLFVTNLILGERVPLYGDGLNVRDWMYVSDNCEALRLVLEQGEVGSVYNVGAGNELTNVQVTDALLDLLGADDSAVERVEDRLGHDRRYSVTTERIRALGWRPAHRFEDALAETVEFYRTHRDWWEPLRARVRNR
ncbi:MAG: dTDP-glucose 4,6-dehydratase [Microthrixaceae bacterium]|jgi:dTDP-glucose 4,6-dehydratase